MLGVRVPPFAQNKLEKSSNFPCYCLEYFVYLHYNKTTNDMHYIIFDGTSHYVIDKNDFDSQDSALNIIETHDDIDDADYRTDILNSMI